MHTSLLTRAKSWLRVGSVGAISGAILVGGLAAVPAAAAPNMQAAPAAAQAAKDPVPLFTEDFESMGANTPAIGLEDYVGENGMTYTADPQWLDHTDCNGLLIKYTDSGTDCPTERSGENNIRRMSDALGQFRLGVPGGTPAAPANGSTAESQANHALSEFTLWKDVDYTGVMLETEGDLTLASGRFVTAAIDVGVTSCGHKGGINDPRLNFFLTSGSNRIPLQTAPIAPCDDPNQMAYTSPDLPGGWSSGGAFANAGTYYSNGSILLDNGPVGLRLESVTASFDGNDASFDNIRLVDVTPTLHKSFSNPDTAKSSTLTFTVANTSELSSKAGWSFQDAIDPDLVVDPATATTTCTNGAVSFSGQTMSVSGDLASGQATCEISVKVTAKRTGTFQNCPGTNVTDIVGLDGPECATLVVGDYSVSKSSDPASGSIVAEGDKVTYSLTVAATADSPDDAVVPFDVTDSMADVLKEAAYNDDASATAGAVEVESDGDLRWTGTISGDGEATLTFSVTVRPYADGADHQSDNFVVKTGETPLESCEEGDPTCTTHPVAPPAPVSIEKDDHKTVVIAGEENTYDLTVTNHSTDGQDATGVVVTDVLPAQLDFVSATDGGSYDAATRTVTWRIDSLPAGESKTVKVTARVNPSTAPDTDIVNVARVITDHGCTSPDGCETTDIDHTSPQVSISKDDHQQIVRPGEELTYELTVRNGSTKTDATGVIVTDTLPAELEFLSASDGGVYDADSREVVWSLGDLAKGSVREVTVTVRVAQATGAGVEVINGARVQTDQGCTDPDLCETTDIDHTQPEVTIVKNDHEVVVGDGQSLTYELTVTNHSGIEATDAVVTDELPAQLTFESASDGGVFDADAATVTWRLGTLEAGETRTVSITAKVTDVAAGDSITNVATIDTAEGCFDAADCESTDIDHTPDVVIEKDDHKLYVLPGEELTYDLTVRNRAEWSSTETVVSDPLPANVDFTSASDGAVYDKSTRTVRWDLGTLEGHTERTVTVTVTVHDGLSDGTEVVNSATVSTAEGCLSDDCTSTDTDIVDPPAAGLVTTGQAMGAGVLWGAGLLTAAGALMLLIRRRKEGALQDAPV